MDDYTWTGAGDGTSWSDPANWDGGPNPNPVTGVATTPPGADDAVTLSGAVTISDAGSAESVSCDDLIIEDYLSVGQGGLSGNALTVDNQATVTDAGDLHLETSLTVDGSLSAADINVENGDATVGGDGRVTTSGGADYHDSLTVEGAVTIGQPGTTVQQEGSDDSGLLVGETLTVDGGATVAVDIFNSTGGVDYSGVGADLASLQIAAGATASFTQMILGLTGGAVDGVLKLQTSATVNSVDGPLTIGHGAKLTSAASMVTNFFRLMPGSRVMAWQPLWVFGKLETDITARRRLLGRG